MTSAKGNTQSKTHFWWVNQGSTYEQAKAQGMIWAPQQNKAGRNFFHWTNVSKVAAGDVIFHYADGAVRALSVATTRGSKGKNPFRKDNWKEMGWKASVKSYELDVPVPMSRVGQRLRALELDKGPVNTSGGANQGYLFELSPEAASIIIANINVRSLPNDLANRLPKADASRTWPQGHFKELLERCFDDLSTSGLSIGRSIFARLLASLLSKRFLILTGLSGSGKTKLAQAFAHWITPPGTDAWCLVAVGADWTSNERIVGYPDQLNGTYVHTPALDLMLRAKDHPDTPHFLILDEMNLSHVERYFADLLAAMESPESPMSLHRHGEDMDGVPADLILPSNLFIIGTVNVDETTYLFSPKVLDRANVMEFRASTSDLSVYLDHAGAGIDLAALDGDGEAFGQAFVDAAREPHVDLDEADQQRLKAELMLLFETLAEHRAEFGFRVAREITRFVAFYKQISGESAGWFEEAMDAQIVQKILPKFNGSRAKLAGVLWALSVLCRESQRPDIGSTDEDQNVYANGDVLRRLKERLTKAARADTDSEDPAIALAKGPSRYPLSADKLARMWRVLDVNGFVSFTEA